MKKISKRISEHAAKIAVHTKAVAKIAHSMIDALEFIGAVTAIEEIIDIAFDTISRTVSEVEPTDEIEATNKEDTLND